jgi:quercetin dioxygenase-like cupin family protein
MFGRGAERRFDEILPGVRQKTLATTPGMMMCEARLAKGSKVPPHRHPHEQISYVAEGWVRVRINGETATMAVGDCYAIPGGTEHEIDILEDAVIVDVFSPHRDEYRLPDAGGKV